MNKKKDLSVSLKFAEEWQTLIIAKKLPVIGIWLQIQSRGSVFVHVQKEQIIEAALRHAGPKIVFNLRVAENLLSPEAVVRA